MDGRIQFVRSRLLAGYLVLAMLASCSHNADLVIEEPQTEVMQSVEASNGPGLAASRLKRILLLPIVLNIQPEDPESCMDLCEPQRDRAEIALAAADHLEWRIGYDITCLDFACRRVEENPYSDELLSGWAAEIANWANEHPTDRQLPDHLMEIVGRIRSTFGVDGLALVHGDVRYVQNSDMLHWMATLTASMYYNLIRGNTAHLQADIIATESGNRLWSAKTTVTQIGNQSWPVEEAKKRYGVALFGALDVCTAVNPGRPPDL